MNIHEYQAAELLAGHGIPVNKGIVATTPDEAVAAYASLGSPPVVAVKAQVHTGGRGKAGGVKLARSADDVRAAAEAILGLDISGHVVNKVLIAPGVNIAKEFYVSVVLDRPKRVNTLMASAEGGVEIEHVAKHSPEKIIWAPGSPIKEEGLPEADARDAGERLGLTGAQLDGFVPIAQALFKAYVEEDATLTEINPLILTGDGEWLALDSKISFDDNALFRHPEQEAMRDMAEENPTEVEAKRHGISFVKLDGDIGCIVNGAGLAMATMDAVKLHGGEPANFLDVGGGANAKQVATAFRLVLDDPKVRAILINIFGGITRGDIVAQGITDALNEVQVTVPIVVRLSGTNAEEGKAILAKNGLIAVDTMDEAAARVVKAAAGAA